MLNFVAYSPLSCRKSNQSTCKLATSSLVRPLSLRSNIRQRITIQRTDANSEVIIKMSESDDSDPQKIDLHQTSQLSQVQAEGPSDEEFTMPTHYSVDDSDRQDVDDISSEGEQKLDQVAEEVRDGIKSLQGSVEAFADKIIEEETQALIEKYQEQQSDLLDSVEKERDAIQKEMDVIKSLAKSASGRSLTSRVEPGRRERILQTTTLLFGLASFIYAFNALATSDPSKMTNSLIDAAVSVCSAYFLSKENAQ